MAACTPKEKSDKAVERERWIESLNDSVALYKSQIDSATSRLEELHDNVGLMLQDFEYVNNPREVEGYYIYKGWRQRYPLQGNGLVARISKDEGLELIACHKGAPFTSVALSGGDGAAVETEAAPAQGQRLRQLHPQPGRRPDDIGHLAALFIAEAMREAGARDSPAQPSHRHLPPDSRPERVVTVPRQMHQNTQTHIIIYYGIREN